MTMRFALAAVAALMLTTPVASETLVDAYGLGNHKPVPEEWTKIDEELSIRARIVKGKKGSLAPVVQAGQTLTLDLAFYVQPGAKDRPIRLTCSVFFYDARGEGSDEVLTDEPCYEGRLHDGLERFQPLDLNFRFKPRASDPKGTSAVVVRVKDTVIGDGVALAPTYNWQGGR